VSPEVRAHNIETGHCESGHMVYIDAKAATQYHKELVKFVNDALPPNN
jgi:hypothetical protein